MNFKYFSKLRNKARLIKADVVVLYLALKDRRVSKIAKAVILLVVGYALSPIDFIPDFIPVLGYLDEVILLPLGIQLAIRLLPDGVIGDLREKAKLISKLQKNKIAGIIIVLIWISLILIFVNYFFRSLSGIQIR